MKKLIFFLTLFTTLSFSINAQTEYHHGLGGHLIQAIDSLSGGGYGVSYEARLNVANVGESSSVSVSAYPGLGFSGSANSRTGGSFSFSYELPVLASFNIGKFATKDADSGFGFFAGAGYHLYGYGSTDYGSRSGSGIMGMVGSRFQIVNHPIEINLSYSTGHKVIGARIIYLFEGERSRSTSRSKSRRR